MATRWFVRANMEMSLRVIDGRAREIDQADRASRLPARLQYQ